MPVIIGAPELLVAMREDREHYQTNRHIKTWSAWFMLKALTSSSVIQDWNNQKKYIQDFLQVSDSTFRTRLREMQALGLVKSEHSDLPRYNCPDIHLCSYKEAASILGLIKYKGTFPITYNVKQNSGNQIFQYLLRAEEIRSGQNTQLEGMMYNLDKNLPIKNDLHRMLIQAGADEKQLRSPYYFQERLLQLQIKSFREASEIFDYIYTHRADINRSVKLMKDKHNYKCKTSVSYMKKRMFNLGLITVKKICVESKERCRFFIPSDAGGRKDGYKWIDKYNPISRRNEGHTAWFLCDQITFNYSTPKQQVEKNEKAKQAA